MSMEQPNKRQKVAGTSKVLHVRALPQYTTEAELTQLVSPFGQVTKCLLLQDKGQAFLQMPNEEAAGALLASLEFTQPQIRGKAIYFQFSSRQEIDSSSGGGGAGAGGQATCTLLIAVQNVTVPVSLDNIVQICKPYGEVLKVITFPKGADFQALVQMSTVEQAMNAKMFLDGKDLFQGCCHLRVNFSNRTNLVVKENSMKSRDFTQGAAGGAQGGMLGGMGAAFGQQQMGMGGMGGMAAMGMGGMGGQPQQGTTAGSTVVLVNKMNEATTPDALFMLFGVYGDVVRVKILFNKRDTAMVQFTNPNGAYTACQNLGGTTLFGAQIACNLSKHREIQMPKETDEVSLSLTKDYTGHAAHRFKNKTHTNHKNVCAPSQVLHVSNLHDAATEQELRELFATQQPNAASLPVVEFFKTSRKMAYVAMASLDDAINALIALHSSDLGGYPLRVSFSHKTAEKLVNSDDPSVVAAAAAAAAADPATETA